METLASRLQAACPVALATLIRLLGDIDAAEDALQEATARALATWPHRGMPDNPSAWLIATARNHTVDLHRRRAMEVRHLRALAPLEMPSAPPPDIDADGGALQDDLLRLIFTCCHPALSVEAQIALTLKTVAGLSVDDIGRAFLTAPRTMEQRLTRAKRKIRDAGIPYRVPGDRDLAGRLEAVLAVVYLIFNAGYNASAGPDLIRTDLCEQAIRLGRTVGRLFRAETEVTGLLALMLLHHSRRRARQDGDRRIVPLDRQDRRLWDRAQIDEGGALVEKAAAAGPAGPLSRSRPPSPLSIARPSGPRTRIGRRSPNSTGCWRRTSHRRSSFSTAASPWVGPKAPAPAWPFWPGSRRCRRFSAIIIFTPPRGRCWPRTVSERPRSPPSPAPWR